MFKYSQCLLTVLELFDFKRGTRFHLHALSIIEPHEYRFLEQCWVTDQRKCYIAYFWKILVCSGISIPETIAMPVGTHYLNFKCYTYLCVKVLHILVKHERDHKVPQKKIYIFHQFPVEIKRWICSYVTAEVPTGLHKQTHQLSS